MEKKRKGGETQSEKTSMDRGARKHIGMFMCFYLPGKEKQTTVKKRGRERRARVTTQRVCMRIMKKLQIDTTQCEMRKQEYSGGKEDVTERANV